jgi:Lar family restriction alleviation protein
MSALKPCPFCGGEALYTPTCHIDVVQCRVCGAQGMAAMGQPEAAIAAWNRRAGDDEVEKLREVLRIAIEALDAADMPHTADAIRTALGDTP